SGFWLRARKVPTTKRAKMPRRRPPFFHSPDRMESSTVALLRGPLVPLTAHNLGLLHTAKLLYVRVARASEVGSHSRTRHPHVLAPRASPDRFARRRGMFAKDVLAWLEAKRFEARASTDQYE